MSYQSEAELEKQLINKLSAQGYSYIKLEDYKALESNFRVQLNYINKSVLDGVDLSDKEFERILIYLNGKTVYQSAKQLRDQFILDRDNGKQVYINFLNENPENNVYQVTNQVTVQGKYVNRYDVTILINGLPLVQIELKRRGVDINQAINQIDRYRQHSFKELFKYIQIFVVSNGVETRYFANTNEPRIMKSLTFYWTREDNERINILENFSSEFLEKNRLLKMITKYMVINDTDKCLIVMRPYQVYATEALIRQALNTNSNGYIWHTTGSGKTLTSWKCANLLKNEPSIAKVFFLIDRKDLDTQTIEEFNKFEKDCVDNTDDTKVLVKQVKDPNKKLIVTTIQKMAKALNTPKYLEVMNKYKNDKVIFIIDECHRSQFGEMHNQIKRHFVNAQYFGFTGTPRFVENKSQDGRTTADMFQKLLHAYLIKNAIHDHNVLGFSIEYIQTYEGEYDENDETRVEDIDREEVFMADERINMIANHIINHHSLKTRNGKYTSIFAVSSIPQLIKYYDTFKKLKDEGKHNYNITAVYSYGSNEDLSNKEEHSRDSLERIIKDYNEMFETNFDTNTFSAYNKDISNRLKQKKNPQIDILLVVNMYLTGFDSRPLNTLYVDKNLDWHNLLQAFSRTNRVEKETKPFGNIVCYRNLKKKTDDAIKLFSQTDKAEEVLVKDYDYYKDQFEQYAAELYKLASTPQAVDGLMDENDQAKFVIAFRELSKILLILKTFVEFSWEDLELTMTQQSYEDYKSRYLTINDNIRKVRQAEKVSILNDIDFSIEIIQTDKINVAYIMNLLRNIDFTNYEQKEKDINNIYKELDRSDNPELRRKVDLIKQFIGEVVPKMSANDSVDEEYSNFETAQRNKEIEDFAFENKLEPDFIKNSINDYEFTEILDKDKIREGITSDIPYFKKKSLVEKIMEFIINNVTKYQ